MTPNARTTTLLASAAAVGMLALGFAAEPLYSTFCKVTGFGGTTREVVTAPETIVDRAVRVRLDSNLEPGLGLEFRPGEPWLDVQVGETVLTHFEVRNTNDAPVQAMATYNVAPHKAGRYFSKIECFCFEEMVFAPGETQKLPVVFFVDPKIVDDAGLDDVATITLSYTYFRSVKGRKPSAGGPATAS